MEILLIVIILKVVIVDHKEILVDLVTMDTIIPIGVLVVEAVELAVLVDLFLIQVLRMVVRLVGMEEMGHLVV
tara:strand:+ start:344 stop:562 length:219 start_codon:yes stop_codon:yes gene_type:complete